MIILMSPLSILTMKRGCGEQYYASCGLSTFTACDRLVNLCLRKLIFLHKLLSRQVHLLNNSIYSFQAMKINVQKHTDNSVSHHYRLVCIRTHHTNTQHKVKSLCQKALIPALVTIYLIPSRVSGRGYKIGPVCLCVCVSVCHLVGALTAELFDVQT